MAFLLERHDHAKPLIRSVVRELLCSCALRSAILFFNPYSLNRVGGPAEGNCSAAHGQVAPQTRLGGQHCLCQEVARFRALPVPGSDGRALAQCDALSVGLKGLLVAAQGLTRPTHQGGRTAEFEFFGQGLHRLGFRL